MLPSTPSSSPPVHTNEPAQALIFGLLVAAAQGFIIGWLGANPIVVSIAARLLLKMSMILSRTEIYDPACKIKICKELRARDHGDNLLNVNCVEATSDQTRESRKKRGLAL